MDVRVADAKIYSFESELIVVGLFVPAQITSELKAIDEKLHGAIAHVLKRKEFEGEYGQNRLISTLDKIPAKNILLLGLGKKEDARRFTNWKSREQLLSRAHRQWLKGAGLGRISISNTARSSARRLSQSQK